MLVSVNPTPPMEDFKSLMEKTNELLNKDAQKRHAHYASLNGTALEDDQLPAGQSPGVCDCPPVPSA